MSSLTFTNEIFFAKSASLLTISNRQRTTIFLETRLMQMRLILSKLDGHACPTYLFFNILNY